MTSSRSLAAVLVLFTTAFGACEEDDNEQVFRATLNGQNAGVQTSATGTAEFVVNEDNTIDFTLDVSNLSNVAAAHIHGPAGASESAGVIVGLFSGPTMAGPVNGRVAEGTITTTGHETIDITQLLQLMSESRVYVNVHTNDGVAPGNTGPGDFPGGEIRGQIVRVD